MDGWKINFLLGWPNFRGELLVSGRVSRCWSSPNNILNESRWITGPYQAEVHPFIPFKPITRIHGTNGIFTYIYIPWKSAKCGWICVNISYVDPMGNDTMHRVLFKSSAIAELDNKVNRANATCWRFLEKSHHGAQNKPLMSSVVSAKHGKTWGIPVPLYHGWDWPLSGLVDLTQAGVCPSWSLLGAGISYRISHQP